MGRKPKKENLCIDCGKYALGNAKDYFMVGDELWKQFGCGGGLLCLDCFQKRLGRPLLATDFIDCQVNKENPIVLNLK